MTQRPGQACPRAKLRAALLGVLLVILLVPDARHALAGSVLDFLRDAADAAVVAVGIVAGVLIGAVMLCGGRGRRR